MLRAEFSKKAAPLGAAFLFLAAALTGCATSDRFGGSRQAVLAWSQPRGFVEVGLPAGRFQLLTLARMADSEVASIYIEGDGDAWATAYHPPRDPTPTKPVSLALTAADPAAAVVYVGRPCQYLDAAALRGCDSAYWTERRFAPEVIEAYDGALSQLKQVFGVKRFRLFGYSGGGVLATLLAARRDDVDVLVTIAAPLALAEWLAWHEATSLRGSLDPLELGENTRLPRSVHFVGERDKVVPPAIVGGFVSRKGGRIETVAGFDHECCWARDWAALLGRVNVQENAR